MEKEKKITKRDNLMEIRKFVIANDNITDSKKEQFTNFIDHEIELLDKKAMSKGSAKNTQEQEDCMNKILIALAKVNEPITITDLQKNDETIAEYSNQKLSAMLSKLIAINKVEKIQEKRKSYFKLV